MFTDLTRARRIEAGEGALARAVARGVARGGAAVAVDDLDGGVAVLTRAGLPTNKVIGIGLGDAGALDGLDAVEARWWAVGEPVRIELASLARVEVGRALTSRGYQLEGVEHVLVRDLAAPLPSPPPGVAIEDVSSATDDEWLTCAIDGFANPDGANPAEVAVTAAALEPVFRDLSAAEVTRYLARLDGALAGTASAFGHEGALYLCGASTAPAYRRRGVQRALLLHRLAEARAGGADLAVVTTSPGSQSQANVMALGFALAYTRVVLVRPPPA
ncbi:MAG: GNAT family N-acetyltransferase [Kofleriaceae bacterium]|nr:GNAT family N-acetyltransferase [Kofleriaceae bacterium]MBP9170720.1 GNAT family N-acetyltransferase [Kofleriaceae bacterium]MBP9857364.1 GNAT family N-acetyltransferase [Kofleriaceae bacterium]